jgi:hypothetical protein
MHCRESTARERAIIVYALAHANEILKFVHANSANATSDIHLYNEARDLICKMLDDCGIESVRPSGAFSIFPKILANYGLFSALLWIASQSGRH